MDETRELMLRLHQELAQRSIGVPTQVSPASQCITAVSTTSRRLLGRAVDYSGDASVPPAVPAARLAQASPPRPIKDAVTSAAQRSPLQAPHGIGVDEVNLRRHLDQVDMERSGLQQSLANVSVELSDALGREAVLKAKLSAAQEIIEELELANRELVSSHSACAWRLREQVVRLNSQLLSDAAVEQPKTIEEWKAKCSRLTERNVALLSDLTEAQQDIKLAREESSRVSTRSK
jgi:hypothetical protein